jgi:hypothetical protein
LHRRTSLTGCRGAMTKSGVSEGGEASRYSRRWHAYAEAYLSLWLDSAGTQVGVQQKLMHSCVTRTTMRYGECIHVRHGRSARQSCGPCDERHAKRQGARRKLKNMVSAEGFESGTQIQTHTEHRMAPKAIKSNLKPRHTPVQLHRRQERMHPNVGT